MNTILELLLTLSMFNNLIKVPQPPERLDRSIFACPVACVDTGDKLQDSSKKLEEIQKTEPTEETDSTSEETQKPKKKTIYTMTTSELNALSLKKKAKLVHMSKKNFKTFVKLVNRESGPKMQDKILVAAVVWNRKYCKDYPKTVKKVMFQGGQFALKGQKKTVIHGNYKDKDSQLAILLAYRLVHTNQIPHNVKNFNSISYRYKDSKRFTRYRHVNNYFVHDNRCKCKWCKETS